MTYQPGRVLGLAVLLSLATASVGAVEIAPHRALYTMSLASVRPNSGVVGARGTMIYEWGETCDGWTVQQRYRLRMLYAEASQVDVSSNYVTWESKDGLRYRFNERKLRNGEVDEEVRGEAHLDGPGKGGVAEFTRPDTKRMELAPGVIFPTMHTIELIRHAEAGDQFFTRQVFDGTNEENAVQISAVIAGALSPQATAASGDHLPKSPLLLRPSWRARLAFFPYGSKSEQPDYELGTRILDNGVSSDMVLDYGDFSIKARLDDIEALPKPTC